MSEPIRLLIADDHRLIARAVRFALERAGGFEVVAEATSGAEVLPLIAREQPDVALLDIGMPDMDGLTALERIGARYPEVKVLMFSASHDEATVATAFERGARAFVAKNADPRELVDVIRAVAAGTVDRATVGMPAPEPSKAEELGLTRQEFAVLAALARGLSNKEIAKEHWISDATVKFHLRNAYRKLGLRSRTDAIRFAQQQGILRAEVR